MVLLSSIMSGKPDNNITNLVSKITNKIEDKINNGEIDRSMLEKQAKDIMGTVGKSNINIEDMTKMFSKKG